MPTQSDLAREWNLSRQRVGQLVKQGCPLTSWRAAERWKDNRVLKRSPTNGKFAEIRPTGDEPFDPGDEKKPMGRPMRIRPASNTGDPLKDAQINTATIANMAYEAVEKAIRDQRYSALSSLMSVHNKAIEAKLATETAVREEKERRGILVDKAVIIDICRRSLEPIIRRIRKLAPEAGPQCSPEEPLRAVKVLERETNKILALVRKTLEEGFDAARKS